MTSAWRLRLTGVGLKEDDALALMAGDTRQGRCPGAAGCTAGASADAG